MAMNDNTKDLSEKVIICHKLVNDRGTLATICGRNEKPQPSATTH
jgi:hypothetical protein